MAKRQKQSKSSSGDCELTICEDPNTGQWFVKSSGKCPKGYIEKAKQGLKKNGILFPVSDDD